MSEPAAATSPGESASDPSRGGIGRDPAAPPPSALPPIVPGAKKLYFINAFVDFMLVGGASIAAFMLLRHFHTGDRTPAVYTLGAQLMWVCNWPHFAATNYRLYHSRANIAQYPLTALVIPWVVAAGVIGSLAEPERFAPIFVMIYLLWSPYHFSGQTVGVTMVYARRSGFRVGKLERFFLSSFVFGTFICTSIRAHVDTQGQGYFGVQVPGLGVPKWAGQIAEVWVYLAGIAFLLLVLKWCVRNQRGVPLIVLLPSMAQFVWFMPILGGGWPAFQEFVPFFHSLQYLLIAWAMQLKETVDEGAKAPDAPAGIPALGWCLFNLVVAFALARMNDPRVGAAFAVLTLAMYAAEVFGQVRAMPSVPYALLESMRWAQRNFGVGVALFFLLPKIATVYGTPEAVAIGVVTAGVQIHHFFVDGVIWKLKSPHVASPLMVNIDDLVRAPEPAPAMAGGSGMAAALEPRA
jgi:hypothetical protein